MPLFAAQGSAKEAENAKQKTIFLHLFGTNAEAVEKGQQMVMEGFSNIHVFQINDLDVVNENEG